MTNKKGIILKMPRSESCNSCKQYMAGNLPKSSAVWSFTLQNENGKMIA